MWAQLWVQRPDVEPAVGVTDDAHPVQQQLLLGFTADATGRFWVRAPAGASTVLGGAVASVVDVTSRFGTGAPEPSSSILSLHHCPPTVAEIPPTDAATSMADAAGQKQSCLPTWHHMVARVASHPHTRSNELVAVHAQVRLCTNRTCTEIVT